MDHETYKKHLPDVINMIKLKPSCQPTMDNMKTNQTRRKQNGY